MTLPQKVAAITMPGYYAGAQWDTPWALAQPAAMAAAGANTICLQTSYTPASQTSVDIGPCSVPDAGLAAMCAAARAAGLAVVLKPHCTPADWTPQSTYLPGAQVSYGVASWEQGKPGFTVAGLNLTAANEGHRIIAPYGALVASALSNYGHTEPAWPTIAKVTGPTSGELSMPPTWSVDQPVPLLVLDGAAVDQWMAQWQAAIDHQLAVCDTAGGVDAVNLSTEQDWLTAYFGPQWRKLIAHYRQTRPGLGLYVQTAGGLANPCMVGFIDDLDYNGVSAYPTVGSSSGGDPVATTTAGWRTATAGMAAYSQSWGKRILFGEVGARAGAGAGYTPWDFSRSLAADGGIDQAAFLGGMFAACWDEPWMAGAAWWTWYSAADAEQWEDMQADYALHAPGRAIWQQQVKP